MEIISGTANGADRLGEAFALKYGIEVKRFPAQWHKYGKSAGYVRNNIMAQYAAKSDELGVLIAFWDGKSKGTKMMIDLAKKNNLKVFGFEFNYIKCFQRYIFHFYAYSKSNLLKA